MTDTRTIAPADGRRVRHPISGLLLAAGGAVVAWTSYWQRLLDAGDVVETPAAPAPAPQAAPQSAADLKPAKAAVKDVATDA